MCYIYVTYYQNMLPLEKIQTSEKDTTSLQDISISNNEEISKFLQKNVDRSMLLWQMIWSYHKQLRKSSVKKHHSVIFFIFCSFHIEMVFSSPLGKIIEGSGGPYLLFQKLSVVNMKGIMLP